MNTGKRFEKWWSDSANRFEHTKVYRIPDKLYVVNGKVFSRDSEADFFWFGDDVNPFKRIVECKAHSGKSIPFSELREDQEESLAEFSQYCEAIVAVNLYDSGNLRNFNRCFHVPFDVWMEHKEGLGRKSLPLQVLEDDERIKEFKRMPGSVWDMSEVV